MKNEYGFYFWVHLCVIVVLLVSPLFFSAWLVLAGIAIFYLQLKVCGGCYLSQLQFGKDHRGDSFFYHYLIKLGLPITNEGTEFFVGKILPWLILGVAIILQLVLGFEPIII